ncbi:MAG TPA: tetratricopeptide repeat protein [Bacteroidia bacterium]|nr:tetratricopeptide repeat protein [Bacteroidia bacterium]
MKRIILFLFPVFVFTQVNVAQTAKIDSLRAVLTKTLPDTQRIITLNILALELRSSDAQASVSTGMEALSLARKIKYPAGEARADLMIGAAQKTLGNYNDALQFLAEDSLICDRNGWAKDKASALNSIGNVFYYEGNYPEALRCFYSALHIFEKLKLESGVALVEIGIEFYDKNK